MDEQKFVEPNVFDTEADENENNMSSNKSTKKIDSINSNTITDLSSSCQFIKDKMAKFDISFKIILIGDAFVGKSSLTIKAANNLFDNSYKATIGFEFYTMFFKINSKIIRLQICDTCGQEEYRSLIETFYHNSSLAILVYSIDKRKSFENLEIWLNKIKEKGNPAVKIFLVGNKNDLIENRKVSIEEGEKFYEDHQLNFFIETSAKTGLNAEELFKKVAIVLNQEHIQNKDMAFRDENDRKKCCCC